MVRFHLYTNVGETKINTMVVPTCHAASTTTKGKGKKRTWLSILFA